MSETRQFHDLPRRLPIMPLPLPILDDRAQDGRKVILFTFDGRCFAARWKEGRWTAEDQDHDHFYGTPVAGWLPFPA